MKTRVTRCAAAAVILCGVVADAGEGRGRRNVADQNQQVRQVPQQQAVQFDQEELQELGQINNVMRFRNGAPQQQVNQHGVTQQRGTVPTVLSAADVRRATDRAVAFLRASQQEDGSIGDGGHRDGATAMGCLAMLAAGGDPESDPSLRRALKWLHGRDVSNTYVRAIRANVWEYALRRSPEATIYREALEEDFKWLVKALGKKEGWRYGMNSSDWDNSVTQYGVLGVWAACRAGLQPPKSFWPRMSRHFRDCQNPDGGWGYKRGGSSANMATAGLATMFLVFDMYHGQTSYSAKKGNPFAKGDAAKVLESIDRGMAWLNSHGGSNSDGYYLYGIERTGVASGRKYIGGHDWFRDGVGSVLQHQRGDGGIEMSGHGGLYVGSAFSTMFMVYGGAPVAFNKLQYGEGQSWNLNPRDMANVTKHLWGAYEQPLNWFSVELDASVEEFEAPVLFISGNGAPEFTDAQVDTLRAYVERGGLILAEPSDKSDAFTEGMEALLRRLYPAATHPTYGLKALGADHPIYTVIPQTWEERPPLRAASDGSRSFFVLSDSYLSRDWQMNHTHTDAFKLAMNLLFYATDLGELHGRFHSQLPSTAAAPAQDQSIKVSRLVYGQGGDDDSASCAWRVGPAAVKQFANYLQHTHGVTLEDGGAVALSEGPVEDELGALMLTGNGEFNLDAEQTAELKRYLAAGGTLVVDAYAGSERFAAEARRYLQKQFGDLVALPVDHDLVVGRFPGGFDLASGVSYTLPARKALRSAGKPTGSQHLEAVVMDGRAAIIFSPYDLTGAISGANNYRAAGYRPASARKVLSNIFGYIAHGG